MAQVRQPKGIKKQAAEAKKLQEELIKNPADDVALDAVQEPNPADDAELAAKADEDKNLDQPDKDAKSEELAAKPETDWEKRFNGLKASYDREVPKLRGELDTAHTAVDEVNSKMAALQEKIEQLESKPEVTAPAPVVFTDEEREQYGDGYINMMEKVAEQSNTELVKTLMDVQAELASLKQGQKQVKEHAVVSDEQRFFSGMNERVGSDWEKTNTNPEFLKFLDEEVPYSGKTRLDFLREARKNLDLEQVSGIFNDFKATSTNGESQDDVPSIPEELISPNSKGGGKPPAPELRVYTSQEVTDFYTDKTKGRYKGKEEEARAIEKDIIAAGQQGRIVTKRGHVSA